MLIAAGKIDYRPRFEPMQGRGTLVSKNDASSSATFQGVDQPIAVVVLAGRPQLHAAIDG